MIWSGEGSFRYANATELSRMLATIKFFSRCIVVIDVYDYNDHDTCTAWQRAAKATDDHSDNGIGYVNYMLSFCHRLRDSEGVRIRFIICPTHTRCAIIDGVELSIQDLGRKMKSIQRQS